MPFDKLPGRLREIPQLVHPFVPPARPVIPYGEWITHAVDKIAQAADPVNRAERRATLENLSLQPQRTAVERAKLGYEQNLYGGLSQSGLSGAHFKMTAHGPMPYDALDQQRLGNSAILGKIRAKQLDIINQKPATNRANWYSNMAGFSQSPTTQSSTPSLLARPSDTQGDEPDVEEADLSDLYFER